MVAGLQLIPRLVSSLITNCFNKGSTAALLEPDMINQALNLFVDIILAGTKKSSAPLIG
jgi:hypothetical protein